MDPRDHLGSRQVIALVTDRDRDYRHSMSSAPGRVIPSTDQPPSIALDNM
jgi:hypothetical protein